MKELTKEQIQKLVACETAEELMAAAKGEGLELTREEAEAYLAAAGDCELDEATLKKAAGGIYSGMDGIRLHAWERKHKGK